MPQKMLNPNTTLWWFPEAALTTPSAPIDTDFATAGVINFSEAIVAGYTLNPTDSDTQSSKSIVDEGSGQSKGAANYQGLISFFREADPATNTTSIYQLAYTTFKLKNVRGFWVRRIGKPNTAAIAEDDLVDVFKFVSWTPRVETDGKGAPIRFTVPFLAQGFVRTNVAVVAGA